MSRTLTITADPQAVSVAAAIRAVSRVRRPFHVGDGR